MGLTQHDEKLCHVICQSHIDMAWFWRWDETVGFIRDTFEGEIGLLEKHPDYTFCQSQLIAYMTAQERFPELFEKIKKHVDEGRWEIVGGELVECDHLIASGESLVRQLLYGQIYARKQFGLQATVGWSPDSFGHNGNLPQILAKSGIENFIYKRPLVGEQDMPVTPFWWRGIDGSAVLAYRTTNKGWDFVNPIPDDVAKRHDLRHTWGYSGTGDRGGVRPYKELGEDEHGKHIYSTPSRYFEAVRSEARDLPVFAGELNYCYEGTYTTHADAKIANRRCENLLYLAESVATAAHLEGVPYPADELTEAWRKLGFNQFHDILPGTSVPEVYEDAARDYAQIEEIARGVVSRSAEPFVDAAREECVSVYNPLAFTRRSEVDGDEISPWSFRTRDETVCRAGEILRFAQNDSVLDNGVLRVTVDPESGWIEQIVDLRDGREVLASPGGNVLTLWKEDSFDNPSKEEWNAWDIGISDKSETAELVSPPRAIESELGLPAIECTHKWGKSEFSSVISLLPDADFVDVRLECDWQETLVLLRTEFCVNLPPEAEAWHEIAYGAVRRDKDGQEAPSHRWVGLSDADYGAALINDSRCAHSVKGNTIRMTLLRCATNPDPVSDRGTFSFHYRFRPHEGTWRDADIVKSAYELNVPVAVLPGRVRRRPQLPSVEGEGVHVGACKVSEDGEGIVLRLYESRGGKSRAVVRVNERLGPAFETNLLEDVQREIEIEDGVIDLAFSPFEIKTLLLTVRSAG